MRVITSIPVYMRLRWRFALVKQGKTGKKRKYGILKQALRSFARRALRPAFTKLHLGKMEQVWSEGAATWLP
jgi:hypothetical protein